NDTVYGSKMQNMLGNLEKSSIEIAEITKNLNSVIGEIKEGKGALNYLVKDTLLVNSLEITIKNIEESSILFNENMEALKHSFLTRGYFRKLEEEKKKESKQKK
ncbi:MAG: MCE family protein, partial [Maribacter sp.]|nr:MCE family protein [Maribacter sp.]